MVKALLLKCCVSIVAAALWLPSIHLFFPVDIADYRAPTGVAPKARMLAEQHLSLWRDPVRREQSLASMQAINPEWDFMSRTYFVLALANMALRDASYRDDACEIIDAIIADTLRIEQEKGQTYFLLDYAHVGPWIHPTGRSIFVDGEIVLMMAARRFVREDLRYKKPMHVRVRLMIEQMEQSPVLSAESYPDQCWLFCNTVGLAAIRMVDVLDGSDHSEFLRRWVQTARRQLTNAKTGLLISSYSHNGTPDPSGACPEGSSIFMSAHMLDIVDPEYARDQYNRAAQGLRRSFLGFGYAQEWAEGCTSRGDVDSGPIVPFLDASAGASGMAVLGASAFEDTPYLQSLLRSLEFAAFPRQEGERLEYRASNAVGDAVLLYALVQGPLWARIKERI